MNTDASSLPVHGWEFPVPRLHGARGPACGVKSVVHGGTLELCVSGLLAGTEAVHLRLAIHRCLRCNPKVRAVIVNLRKALVLLDDDLAVLPGTEEGEFDARRRPMAIVVMQALETRCLLWAWEMATQGLQRAAFIDRDEALAWARAHA